MREGNEIIEELKNMGSPLADMSRAMPYSVPAGYFDQLPGEVLDAINFNEIVKGLKQYETPYQVPDGYFDALPLQLLRAAKAQDEVATAPVMPAKQIAFIPQLKWAVAAVMALVISFGSYVMFSGNNISAPEKMLSSVPRTDISDYIQRSYGIDPAAVVPAKAVSNLNVDNKEIVAYLDETGWD